METGTAILIIGVGAAGFLFWRSQQQSALAVQQAQAAAAGSIPASGGGITGLAERALANWKADPLGIQNTKQLAGAVLGAGKNAVTSVASAVGGVVSSISHIF